MIVGYDVAAQVLIDERNDVMRNLLHLFWVSRISTRATTNKVILSQSMT